MTTYIGLDLHSKRTHIVIQDAKGNIMHQGSIPTSRKDYQEFFQGMHCAPGTKVGMESGLQAFWAARLLLELGLEPVVIDAAEVRAKVRRKRQKSDSRDAFEICDGLRRGIYESVVYVPTREVERLRMVLKVRAQYVGMRVKVVNAAKAKLRKLGLSTEGVRLTTKDAWKRLIAREDLAAVQFAVKQYAETWWHVQKVLKVIEQEISDAVEPFKKEIARLETVPGVGRVTAASFVAAVGEVKRFVSSGKVASYLGLVPSTYDSGERERHGRITKSGPSWVRAVLCEAAHQARRTTHPLNPYWLRVIVRGGYRKAVIAVAHRMARIMYQMWRHEKEFDETRLNVEHRQRVRQRVVHYQIKVA